MNLAALPILFCMAAVALATVGVIVGLVYVLLGSRRRAVLAIVWTVLPALCLFAGAWAWLPLSSVIRPEIFGGPVADRLFWGLYFGSPVAGFVVGLIGAARVARRLRPRLASVGADDWVPPDPADVRRTLSDRGDRAPEK